MNVKNLIILDVGSLLFIVLLMSELRDEMLLVVDSILVPTSTLGLDV